MKVLVVGPGLNDPGGVANYYNAVFPRLSGDGVEVQYLQIGSTYGGRLGLHIIGDQLRLWRAIGSFSPDIVHLNPSLDMRSFLRDGVFILVASLRRRTVLVFFRGWQNAFEKKISGLMYWFFRKTYGRADRFIVLANRFCGRLREWGVTAPIALATTAVADDLLEGFSVDQKVEDIKSAGTLKLLYLARLERDKGVLELIDAVRLLLERGAMISLTIAGAGPTLPQVQSAVSALGTNGNRVHIAGYVRGNLKKDVLQSHHVYCFPTHYGEGMPNSVLEAMAFGMPVVTCPVGGIPDFFVDHKMGVLLEKVEPRYIADVIEMLISSRDSLSEIARYNHVYAKNRFLASVVADNLRAQYQLASS